MRVLVVEADPAIRDFLSTALTAEGHQVSASGDLHDAHVAMEERRPNLVVADLDLIDELGWGFLRDHPKPVSVCPPVLMYTVEDPATLRRMEDAALQIGACCFLRKPFDLEQFIHTVAFCGHGFEPGADAHDGF